MAGDNRVSANVHRCIKKRVTNIECLPDDLFFNILLLLPAQDIYDNARLVCRKWYHMIHTHTFVHEHFQHTTCGLLIQSAYESQHPLFMTMRQGRIVMSKFGYNFRDNVLASCNGLILESEIQNKDVLYIANPVTKQQLALPPFLHGCLLSYGIAYAAASMVYKVVVTYASHCRDSKERCGILTVGVDKSWRHVDIQHLSHSAKVELSCTPKITEGFMHWYRDGICGLTLNLESEIITEAPVPQVFGVKTVKYLLSTGKHLSLLIPYHEFSWEVWEMKPETGEWTKLPNIDMEAQKGAFKRFGCKHNRTLVPVGWLIHQEVLVFDSINPNRACIAYNIRTQGINSLNLAAYGSLYFFKVHRNSLVWLDS